MLIKAYICLPLTSRVQFLDVHVIPVALHDRVLSAVSPVAYDRILRLMQVVILESLGQHFVHIPVGETLQRYAPFVNGI